MREIICLSDQEGQPVSWQPSERSEPEDSGFGLGGLASLKLTQTKRKTDVFMLGRCMFRGELLVSGMGT